MSIVSAVVLCTLVGAVGAIILVAASKFMAVEEDPRIEEVAGCLAGANCGGCGYAGCADYAKAVVMDGVPCDKCAPGGPKAAAAIAKIMETARRNARIFFTICFLLSNFTGNSAGTVWMLSFYRSFAQKNRGQTCAFLCLTDMFVRNG